MGNQDSATPTAATSMRLLRNQLTQPRPTNPEATRRATRVHGAPVVDLGLLDHLEETRTELIAATRRANPNAGPAPVDEGIYAWSDAATAHLQPGERQARDVVAHRQALEHALRVGDERVIRQERCPGCRCYSLMWRGTIERAVCIQARCRDEIGRASQWELKQVAHHHVTSRPQRAAN
ncbi:hypothetical protein [Streptomyces sp. NPDC048611]|uniref:hypothetical protein n=1 Tax=Streptomyces sp. NPDC048611 TaxID=3155635 RepID=UPI003428F89F